MNVMLWDHVFGTFIRPDREPARSARHRAQSRAVDRSSGSWRCHGRRCGRFSGGRDMEWDASQFSLADFYYSDSDNPLTPPADYLAWRRDDGVGDVALRTGAVRPGRPDQPAADGDRHAAGHQHDLVRVSRAGAPSRGHRRGQAGARRLRHRRLWFADSLRQERAAPGARTKACRVDRLPVGARLQQRLRRRAGIGGRIDAQGRRRRRRCARAHLDGRRPEDRRREDRVLRAQRRPRARRSAVGARRAHAG